MQLLRIGVSDIFLTSSQVPHELWNFYHPKLFQSPQINDGFKRILYEGFLPMKFTLYITWIHLGYLIYILSPFSHKHF